MTKPKELYRFSEAASIPPFSKPQNFYFCLDKSPSMAEAVGGSTRFEIVRSQLKDALDKIDVLRKEKGVRVDIGLCGFSTDQTLEIVRRDVTSENITEIKAFIDALTTTGGTPYDVPMNLARNFFLTAKDLEFQQSLFFITDGEPVPTSSAYNAANNNADMINRTGQFSISNKNVVDIYTIGIDLADTSFLGLLDNTPRDGVAVINSANSNSLYNMIISTTSADFVAYTITSADTDETHNGEIYVSAAVGRDEVENKNELSRANLSVSLSIDNAMARRWMRTSVDTVVTVTLFVKDGNEVSVAWKGRLASVKPDEKSIKLVFESIFTSLRRPGLRLRYQRTCPHALYGYGCNVPKEDFAISGEVTAISGNLVTMPVAAGHPAGFFTSGMIESPDGTLRFITGHSGSTLTLIRPLESLNSFFAKNGYGEGYGYGYGGLVVRIYPGCDRTKETCQSKFNNLNNYGGFPFIPLKNPFGGSSIV